jgi:thiamine biosynthesis lipoprotein
VDAWNSHDQGRIPTRDELERLRPVVEVSAVRLNEQASTIFLARSGMRIDIGGIGKGYAADVAVSAMQAAGATGGVIALSGDIKAFGRPPEGTGFRIGIQHPRREDALLGRLELQDEAISTAGDYEKYFERDGVRYHHILDPKTLEPGRECQSVTVVAREGVLADGLDTGLFVMGPQRGMALVERLPDVEAVMVDKEGQVWVSSGLRERIQLETSSAYDKTPSDAQGCCDRVKHAHP